MMKIEKHLPNSIRSSYTRKITLTTLLIIIVVAAIGCRPRRRLSITEISDQIEQLSTEAAQVREYIEQFDIDEEVDADTAAVGPVSVD